MGRFGTSGVHPLLAQTDVHGYDKFRTTLKTICILACPMPQKIAQCEVNVPTLCGVTVTVVGELVIVTVWSRPMSGAVIPCTPCVATNVRAVG